MKLFVFRPGGHGEDTYFVMASSERAARHLVELYCGKNLPPQWGTDYWQVDVYFAGQVGTNPND